MIKITNIVALLLWRCWRACRCRRSFRRNEPSPGESSGLFSVRRGGRVLLCRHLTHGPVPFPWGEGYPHQPPPEKGEGCPGSVGDTWQTPALPSLPLRGGTEVGVQAHPQRGAYGTRRTPHPTLPSRGRGARGACRTKIPPTEVRHGVPESHRPSSLSLRGEGYPTRPPPDRGRSRDGLAAISPSTRPSPSPYQGEARWGYPTKTSQLIPALPPLLKPPHRSGRDGVATINRPVTVGGG